MPAVQRGSAYKLGRRWGLRYRDNDGSRRRLSPFPSRSAALQHYRDVIEPALRGEPEQLPDLTVTAFLDLFLDRHGATITARSKDSLVERLGPARKQFGDWTLRELEGAAADVAAWRASLTDTSRYRLTSAFRQALNAAVRWRYIATNPAVDAGRN